MKVLLFLLLTVMADPSEISRNNKLKSAAEEAFLNKDFLKAAAKYSELYDTLGIRDPKVGLNLAHSHFAMGDTSNATLYYQGVVAEGDAKVKSIAYQQLGVLAKKPETLKESLQYLKSSLKSDPTNEEARYNYELVKKQLAQQQNQDQQSQDQENQENEDQENQDQQDQENQDQENKDQQNQENKEGEEGEENEEQQNQEQDSEQKDGEESEEQKQQESKEGEEKEGDQENQQPSTQQKLEEMNITEDKARMILEAMKNNEVQYIQQQRRKATKPKESGKPDW